ncbi:hypothetical protein E2562_006387 [Oryza meyeriana var. granulata]|uniref:Uncharacterized protein n=1 Tax=Oryza meyeriana var. granulata TaxID=110450 RepID=A0A6G1EFB2_9ORYZ|nr:hypothetical protein E2562_006387 [Oryza meyeriana var. granulata]
MKVLRLLAARRFRRRAVSTITATAPATPCGGYGEDEGPFFDLDLSCCSASAPASSAESGSESEDYSSCAGESDDFVISLQRSRSASPSYERVFYGGGGGWTAAAAPTHLKFCASEPSDAASRYGSGRRGGKLRTLSFGSAKAAFYGGRASFSRSSNSTRSARLFATFGYGSPDQEEANKRTPSRDVIRRYLSKISRQLRRVAPGAGAAAADLRLRKSRSASAAQTVASMSPPPRRDDSLLEQQDGIASAIAHCKESLHRASMSECDSPLLRSRSDPRS